MPLYIFLALCVSFLLYSFSIYLHKPGIRTPEHFDETKAGRGQMVWQKYNCQACHQLFGLGGYLGPDLTNVLSHPQKGEVVVRSIISSGTKQMPAFSLSEEEMSDLLEFLRLSDACGISDPRTYTMHANGTLELPKRN